jgi:dTDP-4-dehydrorhamnose 3,5-epimerase
VGPSTSITGLLHLKTNPFVDARGSFTRVFDFEDARLSGLEFSIENVNLSVNPHSFTLRGFHYSIGTPLEHKLFVCVEGAVVNFTVDTRPNSSTYLNFVRTDLSAEKPETLLVPGGCANAWMTLVPNTRIVYLVSSSYDKARERGFRYNDPYFGIPWPVEPKFISDKDLSWPNFTPMERSS